MENPKLTNREEISQHPKLHTVWVSTEEHTVSFHPVEGYTEQTFVSHEFFLDHLRSLQKCGFRFQ